MDHQLSRRLSIQFAVMRRVTAALRVLGLRDRVMTLRSGARRARRTMFEHAGSARYSRPALHGMDRRLDRIIDRDGGFFVEAGGFDGYTQSNTYYLERFRGWRGILVEPMPELAALARRNRPTATVVQCALVASDFPDDTIAMEFGDLMSTVAGPGSREWTKPGLLLGWRDHRVERVPARPLSDVLDEAAAPGVDLLSLDVEGYEAAALGGLDLTRHAPAWILVEMHDLTAGRHRIASVLGDAYVEHAVLSPLDVLYRRCRESGTSAATSVGSTPINRMMAP
jgi:FkbM family methyltransferase